MLSGVLKRLFGSRNERIIKQLSKTVEQINRLEPEFERLSNSQLRAKTGEFKQRLADGQATLDSILPEAFAVVREASKRTLGLRHFDVQLIGGMVLNRGSIAEMRTGEGKTLVATLPIYLNALTGKGVHLVTVNDYLAKRDAEWMKPIYEMLGLTVGVIVSGLSPQERKQAYAADITYGTNNEFGFDYLRDNMAFDQEQKVQRELHFAIIDEVDSILIDEARTPLIISGQAERSSELYTRINALVPKFKRQTVEDGEGDYTVDEKTKQVHLTEAGHELAEKLLQKAGLLPVGDSLYAPAHIMLVHHLMACLRAHALYLRDVDYIVQDGKIIIIDEHTGRALPGRRWSEGLHQAIEAKEGVPIEAETQTLASITFQNYFRLYEKLAGMTGTADTEAYEFHQIYGLEVVVIPTNKPVRRIDYADQIYLTLEDKFKAIIADIKECHSRQQPVLVGTASIEASEHLSHLLKKEGIPHQVLNAKFHAKEAEIVAQAGRPGAVTIATNMAGRGTDIVLGGNLEKELAQLENPTPEQIEQRRADWRKRHEQVVSAGGLHIIGSERHESRRIDNQLRGRSGRQGDPGSSRFYLSLEDNLLRIFAAERTKMILQRVGMKPGDVIEHPLINRVIENAQRKVETYHFDVRKQLLEFDDVANEQRKNIYELRNYYMEAEDLSEVIANFQQDVVSHLLEMYVPSQSVEEQWDLPGLEQRLKTEFNLELPLQAKLKEQEEFSRDDWMNWILREIREVYAHKQQALSPEMRHRLEKSILLHQLDLFWKDHLSSMDYLRRSIHLRGYAHKNPKEEYKRESFAMLADMLEQFKHSVVSILAKIEIQAPADVQAVEEQRKEDTERALQFHHSSSGSAAQPGQNQAGSNKPFVRQGSKVGRNQNCPCGSGKKYKHCHGKVV